MQDQFIIFLTVLTHFPLELPVHRQDVKLTPNDDTNLGASLFASPLATLLIELSIFFASMMTYYLSTPPTAQKEKRGSMKGVAAFFLVQQVHFCYGSAPTSNSRYIHAPIFLFEILASSWLVGLLDASHGAGFGLDVNLERMKETFNSSVGRAKENMGGTGMQGVGEKMKAVGQDVGGKMNEMKDVIGEKVGFGSKKAGEGMNSMGSTVEQFGHNAGEKMSETVDGVHEAGKGVGEKVGEAGNHVGEGVNKGAGVMSDGASSGAGKVGEGTTQIGSGIGDVSKGVGNGVGEVGRGVGQGVGKLGEGLGVGGNASANTKKGTLGGVTDGIQSVGRGGENGDQHPLDGVQL